MLNVISPEELLKDRNAEYENVLTVIRTFPDCLGIVRYVNHDLSSPQVGTIQLLVIGPSNTIKSLEVVREARTYPFIPSTGFQWQYYPQGWCPRETLEMYLEKQCSHQKLH